MIGAEAIRAALALDDDRSQDSRCLDDGRQREHSVRDIGALLGWIAAQPDLDANRVSVFGGYMVLASAVNYSERLAAAGRPSSASAVS